MKNNEKLVTGAVVTIEDARKAIKDIKNKIPKKSFPQGILIPIKLWKKIKKSSKDFSFLAKI